jgi:hypothetical protein
MHDCHNQDEPVDKLVVGDITEIVDLSADEPEHPRKVPQATIELFFELLLPGSNIHMLDSKRSAASGFAVEQSPTVDLADDAAHAVLV